MMHSPLHAHSPAGMPPPHHSMMMPHQGAMPPGMPFMHGMNGPITPGAAHLMMRHQQQAAAAMAQPPAPFMQPNFGTSPARQMSPTMPPAGAFTPTPTSASSPLPPPPAFRDQRSALKSDLAAASKDELVQLLIELSSHSSDAASFIACKSNIFALRGPAPAQRPEEPLTAVKPANPADAVVAMATETPKKSTKAPCDMAVTPQTPLEEIHQSIHDRRVTPESRAFCGEKHPCLWVYGSCRYSKSCLFTDCPQNLCMGFIRGHCASGAECSLVHRLPADAQQGLKNLVQVNAEREEEERAAAAQGETAPATPVPQGSVNTSMSA